MNRSRARRRALAAAAVLLAVTATAACGDDDGSGDGDVTAAVAGLASSPDTFPTVVQLVAEEGIGDGDAPALAARLQDHLDDLGASAIGDGPIKRPDAVRMFEELADAGETEAMTVALAGWIVELVEPHVGTGASAGDVDRALAPAVAVVAAACDGVDEAEGEGACGSLETAVTEQARADLAALVAAAAGDPAPEPGDYATTLSDAFAGGDPVEEVDLGATRQAEQLAADDPWLR